MKKIMMSIMLLLVLVAAGCNQSPTKTCYKRSQVVVSIPKGLWPFSGEFCVSIEGDFVMLTQGAENVALIKKENFIMLGPSQDLMD